MRKAELNKIFEDGRGRRKEFIAVKIETEGNPSPEVIINGSANFDAKQSYYNKAYDDDLTLISARDKGKIIRITDAFATSNLNDLNWFMY